MVIINTMSTWPSRIQKAPVPFPEKDSIPSGWLPVGIDADSPTIRWMHVGGAEFRDPLFHQTIEALRRSVPLPFEHETDFSVLERGTSHLPSTDPVGFILHMSRCGSTLLLNGLRLAQNVVGLGEPAPVDEVLVRASSPSPYWAGMCPYLLKPILTLFSNYQLGSSRNVVVKGGYGSMAYLRALRRVWPHVPCILLIREPVEVLVSLLQKPPEWMPSWYARSGNQRFGDPPRDVRSRGPAECCAWLTGRLCAEGLAMLDESCRIVDYRDLTPEVVLHIGRFFGLQVSSEVESQLGAAFGVHGKRPHQRFTSDSDAKRLEATQAIRDAADEWAKGPYEALRHRAAGDLARLARPSTEPAEGVPS